MPRDFDRRPTTPARGPLARLDRDREELAKAWILRLLERSSLDEIKSLPTDHLAEELPKIVSDVIGMSAREEGGPLELSSVAHSRAVSLIDLRGGEDRAVGDLARDIAAIQGVLLESLAHDPGGLDAAEVATLAARIAEAVGAIHSAAVEEVLERRMKTLESSANSDELTGLSNRRHFNEQLEQAAAIFKRYETPFAVLVLDVDGLKRVNDSQGHAAGDRVLLQVAMALKRILRTTDTAARVGGDEFFVIAAQQTAEEAEPLARRLAHAIEEQVGGPSGAGVSIGVVSCPEHGDDTDVLLEMADQAMYRAKAGGQSVVLGDPDQPELIKVEKTQRQ